MSLSAAFPTRSTAQTSSEFGGLGIEVIVEAGVTKVVAPIEDTPAHRAGVQPSDLITHIDGKEIIGLTLEQVIAKMRGPVDAPVTLTLVRKGEDRAFDVTMVRTLILINPIKSGLEADDTVVYVKITIFNDRTHSNLVTAIETLKRQAGDRIEGYIIDLRVNPGGFVDEALAVADEFLDTGAIVRIKDRSGTETWHDAKSGDITGGKKIVVLINGGSASASEIVAGALQDHKRAIVIGTRSFGKGSIQLLIPLGTGATIRLTTARYYTPSGRSIQAKGIDPDVVVEQELPPELKSMAPVYVPKVPAEDTQLQYALALLRSAK